MKTLYPSAKTGLLRGHFDFMVDTFKAQLVTGNMWEPLDEVISDVAGHIETAVAITVTAVDDGVALMGDITFPDVGGTDHVNGIVIYQDGSGELVGYVDQRADTVPLDVAPNGGDLTFSFDHLLRI